jgi:hypothetical protein
MQGKQTSSYRTYSGVTCHRTKPCTDRHLTSAEREIDDASHTQLPARIDQVQRIIADVCVVLVISGVWIEFHHSVAGMNRSIACVYVAILGFGNEQQADHRRRAGDDHRIP